MDEKPIISVKKARKIMGKDSSSLTDKEVIKLINDLSFLAKYALESFHEKTLTPKPSNKR